MGKEYLQYKINQQSDGIEYRLSGELLFLDSQDFMREIPERSKGKGKFVRLNMSHLKFIDSSGLGSILYVSEALRMQGQKLVITNVNENNMKLISAIQNVGTFILE